MRMSSGPDKKNDLSPHFTAPETHFRIKGLFFCLGKIKLKRYDSVKIKEKLRG